MVGKAQQPFRVWRMNIAIIRPRVLLHHGPGAPLLLLSVISQSSFFLFHFLISKTRKTDNQIHGF
jgi:hypothetical protein